jgi:hypothetical protein
MSSSTSNFGSFATPLPSADAWGNLKLGTSSVAPTVVNGSGISAIRRNSTGIHGVSFSDPTRFGSGSYVFLVTPEYSSQNIGPFIVSGQKTGGVTAPGFSAGFALSCYGFQTPAVAGGFTIGPNPTDISANTVWANVAAFSFKTTRDLYDPYVANLVQYSEDLTQWSLSKLGTGLYPIVEPNVEPNPVTGELNADKVTLNIGATSANSGDYSILYKNIAFNSDFKGVTGSNGQYTWSFWAKSAGGGSTLSIRGPAVSAYTHITLTQDWKRYSGTEQIANTAVSSMQGLEFTVRGNFDSGLNASMVSAYIWGVQVEPGSVASPYVKTEATYPVFGNQDAKKRFVPGASGYGLTGATYSSSITALNTTRTPTAYGTIVIPPKKHDGSDANVVAYIQDGYNVSGVSAGDYSVFDVSFIKPMNTANYCVILSREIEPQYAAADYAQTYEYAICAIDRSQKTVNGFRAFTLKQMENTNNIQKRGVAYGLGLTERIHFMVFGGGTYGQA